MTNRRSLSLVWLISSALAGCTAAEAGPQRTEATGEGALAATDTRSCGSSGECAPADMQQCASSAECGVGQHCSTEDGVCDTPAGCDPDSGCAAACQGTCVGDPQMQVNDYLSCMVWCQGQGTLGDEACHEVCITKFPDIIPTNPC